MTYKSILAVFQGWRHGGATQNNVQNAQDLEVRVESQRKEDNAHREEVPRSEGELSKDRQEPIAPSIK